MNRAKISFILFITLFIIQAAHSQELINFESPDQLPEPQGGYDSLNSWIKTHMIWTWGQATVLGNVFITARIDTSGTLTDIKIVRGLTEETNQEALRLARKMPPWVPAEDNGKKVNWPVIITIRFEK